MIRSCLHGSCCKISHSLYRLKLLSFLCYLAQPRHVIIIQNIFCHLDASSSTQVIIRSFTNATMLTMEPILELMALFDTHDKESLLYILIQLTNYTSNSCGAGGTGQCYPPLYTITTNYDIVALEPNLHLWH